MSYTTEIVSDIINNYNKYMVKVKSEPKIEKGFLKIFQLHEVPDEYRTLELCLEAVKQNGEALRFVKEQTFEICFEAIKHDRKFIKYIEPKYLKYILKQCIKRIIPRDWLLPLRPVSFLGKNVHIPNKPDALLECEYGKNYLTPDHTCNKACTKCVKI